MRVLAALVLLAATLPANAEVFAFLGGAVVRINTTPQVAVPNVVGEASSAAADTILEGDGLDLGGVSESCSAAADNAVIAQTPVAGVLVDTGSLVDVIVSNGVACMNNGGTGVRLKGLRMRGL